MDMVLRFLAGGVVVSLFALIGDVLKPKSFAGLFGAAPSIALVTISLTVFQKGKAYAASEAQTMILGAIAFLVYACLTSRLLMRGKWPALSITVASLPLWFCCALGLWYFLLG